MYALRDKESPDVGALTSYFRTIEEAEEARSHHRRIDAEGEHPGEEYLEIVEVERESRPCRFCGAEVEASDPTVDWCRMCHYSGRKNEADREAQIAFFAEATKAEVNVEHTGGGCFWLAFRWDGESEFYVATDGEASLPGIKREGDKDWKPLPTGGWGYVGRHSDDEDSPDYEGVAIAGIFVGEYDEEKINAYWNAYPAECLSDGDVVEAILKDRARRKEEAEARTLLDEGVESFDPRSESFLDAVETEWWKQMQGDLNLTGEGDLVDPETVEQVVSLAKWAVENARMTRGAGVQLDGEGNEMEIVTQAEIVRRVVAGMVVLFYGGE